VNRSRFERELEEEMAAHRAMKDVGEPRFGDTFRLREDARDAWGWAWWDRNVQDVTFGSRMLRKSPAFTLTAIALLAIGVGLNITAFQIWDPGFALLAISLSRVPSRQWRSRRNARRSPRRVRSDSGRPWRWSWAT
jgi:hypothetical protein